MTKQDNDAMTEAVKRTADYLYQLDAEITHDLANCIAVLRQIINEEYVHKDKTIGSQIIYDFLKNGIEAEKALVRKAFGGCTKCYGKGYATVLEYVSGFDTDTDIGSKGGKVHFRRDPIVFCTCDRGAQLKKLIHETQSR